MYNEENKMGYASIPKLMLSMGIPVILSMILQACYNIVDSIFVGRMPDMNGIVNTGEAALNALTLAYPIQILIIAFGIGTGVGVNALLATYLGEKKSEEAAKAAGNGVFLGILIYCAFLIFGFFGIDAYLQTQAADPVVLSMGSEYLKICCIFSFGSILFGIYEKLLQSTGKTMFSTIAQVVGALVNIVLDPILIYGLLGAPQMGISGAAVATVIGQVASMLTAAILHYGRNKEVRSGLRYLRPDGKIIRGIYVIGLPAIIMQALMAFMTYGINIIFGAVSASAVTAYGIFYKIQQFLFFAGFGIRDVMTPLIAYNYGAGKQKRVKEGIRCGIWYTEIIMAAGIVVLELFAGPIVSMFGLTDETAALCAFAVRVIAPGFVFAGGCIAMQGAFQALGRGMSSLVVSLLRLAVIVLPLAWVFAQTQFALQTIWLAFPIAELGACIVSVILLHRAQRAFRQINHTAEVVSLSD